MRVLENKLERINEIVAEIDATQPNLRAQSVNTFGKEMMTLENDVLQMDTEMKHREEGVKKAFKNAIDVNRLSHKLLQKYMNFIQSQVNHLVTETQPLVPASTVRKEADSGVVIADTSNDVVAKQEKLREYTAKLDTSGDLTEGVGAGLLSSSPFPATGANLTRTTSTGPTEGTIQA